MDPITLIVILLVVGGAFYAYQQGLIGGKSSSAPANTYTPPPAADPPASAAPPGASRVSPSTYNDEEEFDDEAEFDDEPDAGSSTIVNPASTGTVATPTPPFGYYDVFAEGNTSWVFAWPKGEKKTCDEINTWWKKHGGWPITEETNKLSKLCTLSDQGKTISAR